MKITIDTKEDSYDDIKKVIKMLSSLVEGKEVFSNQRNIFDDKGILEQGNAFTNIFGNVEEKRENTEKDNNKEQEMDDKEESPDKTEDPPKIIEYV
jgi:hypothetical protein